MSDQGDIGVSIDRETIFLYDNYPGGIGQSQPLYQMTAQLLSGARDLISACPCESGCPSCVGPEGETGSQGKQTALRVLAALLGAEIASAANQSAATPRF